MRARKMMWTGLIFFFFLFLAMLQHRKRNTLLDRKRPPIRTSQFLEMTKVSDRNMSFMCDLPSPEPTLSTTSPTWLVHPRADHPGLPTGSWGQPLRPKASQNDSCQS